MGGQIKIDQKKRHDRYRKQHQRDMGREAAIYVRGIWLSANAQDALIDAGYLAFGDVRDTELVGAAIQEFILDNVESVPAGQSEK